jgi:hypothetical protein
MSPRDLPIRNAPRGGYGRRRSGIGRIASWLRLCMLTTVTKANGKDIVTMIEKPSGTMFGKGVPQ